MRLALSLVFILTKYKLHIMNLKWTFMSFLLAIAWCIATPGLAQERTVTGTVTDTAGRPLQSATVLAKGTTLGTQTKQDGSFSLRVPATAQSLVISSLNYAAQEVPITEGTISVRLEPLTAAL